MDDVVPGALQRLREADIVGLAGLAVASLGQEYCRTGKVEATRRHGARLSGIVETPASRYEEPAIATNSVNAPPHRFIVEVEVHDPAPCNVVCTCSGESTTVCAHAAALLFQWLHHPASFVTSSTPSPQPAPETAQEVAQNTSPAPKKPSRPLIASKPTPLLQGNTPANPLEETLATLGLGELRAIAREYNVASVGLGKQQLVEAVVEAMRQPETVRRVVGLLEKPQRQLLAAFTLAGGFMSDEDLRGLFERFALGNASQLQEMLLGLSGKALIMRSSLNSSPQVRVGLGASPLDIYWHVPQEVRHALHVTLPITRFDVEAKGEKDGKLPLVRLAKPYNLLAATLLVARALDGREAEREERRGERSLLSAGGSTAGRFSGSPPGDGSLALPSPIGLPSPELLDTLRIVVPRSTPFLRFAIRLLLTADILYREDGDTPRLRVLPNAAQLLLGPTQVEVAYELFTQWMRHPDYEELFELQEEGLRLRCRATPMNQPILRHGELEAENSEARQTLLALLAQVPSGEWVNFAAYARFVYRLNPTFLQRRQRLFSVPHWWIEQEEGRPLHPTQPQDWMRAEGRYLARLIQGPLYWWGAADIALNASGHLLAFRLTPLATFLLGGVLAEQASDVILDAGEAHPDSPTLSITPGGDLLIPCRPASWPLIEHIEHFAQVTGVQEGQLSYRLSPQSLSAAIMRGESPAALLALLREAAPPAPGDLVSADSPTPGSQNERLQQMLDRLERRIASYGRTRLYTDVSLVQVADGLVMRELSATTSIDEQVVQPIEPTLLIIKKQGVEQLVDELKRRGQVPLLHEEG